MIISLGVYDQEVLTETHRKLFSRPSSSLGLNGGGAGTFSPPTILKDSVRLQIKVKPEVFFPVSQGQKHYFKNQLIKWVDRS